VDRAVTIPPNTVEEPFAVPAPFAATPTVEPGVDQRAVDRR
jgi:hypothetical protein